MNVDDINKWFTLLANIGVLAGIIFLGIEIQQNTQTIEREIEVSFQNTIGGQFVNSDHLPRILTEINEVKGNPEVVLELSETFNISIEDAHRWNRYLTTIWSQNEANWQIVGDSTEICRTSASLLTTQDNEIHWRYSRIRYSPGFVECVEKAKSNLPPPR